MLVIEMQMSKFTYTTAALMVLIEDGNSKIGEHKWIDLGSLICLRHLVRKRKKK